MRDGRVSHGLLYHNYCSNATDVQKFMKKLVELMVMVRSSVCVCVCVCVCVYAMCMFITQTQTQDIDIFVVIGEEHDTKAREKIFSQYRNSNKALIVSVRTIAEGLNLKITDVTALVGQTNSSIRVIQVAGRAVRHYTYLFKKRVEVKGFKKKLKMEDLDRSCHYNDVILNCIDAKNECEFELRVVDAASGLVKRYASSKIFSKLSYSTHTHTHIQNQGR